MLTIDPVKLIKTHEHIWWVIWKCLVHLQVFNLNMCIVSTFNHEFASSFFVCKKTYGNSWIKRVAEQANLLQSF